MPEQYTPPTVWQTGTPAAFVLVGMLIIAGCVMFMLPTIIAYRRHHQQLALVTVVNIVLGATAVGWVAALIWACMGATEMPFLERVALRSLNGVSDNRAKDYFAFPTLPERHMTIAERFLQANAANPQDMPYQGRVTFQDAATGAMEVEFPDGSRVNYRPAFWRAGSMPMSARAAAT